MATAAWKLFGIDGLLTAADCAWLIAAASGTSIDRVEPCAAAPATRIARASTPSPASPTSARSPC